MTSGSLLVEEVYGNWKSAVNYRTMKPQGSVTFLKYTKVSAVSGASQLFSLLLITCYDVSEYK